MTLSLFTADRISGLKTSRWKGSVSLETHDGFPLSPYSNYFHSPSADSLFDRAGFEPASPSGCRDSMYPGFTVRPHGASINTPSRILRPLGLRIFASDRHSRDHNCTVPHSRLPLVFSDISVLVVAIFGEEMNPCDNQNRTQKPARTNKSGPTD